MRLYAVVAASLVVVTSGAAQAYQKCGGSPPVDIYWESSVISVGGTFYQMKNQRLGKKSNRLVGHDMTFVHSKGSNALIRNGGTTRYTSCTKAEGDLKGATIIPYRANVFVPSSESADFPDDTGDGSQASGKGGKGGGHGGGGKGGGGGGGKGGGGGGKGGGGGGGGGGNR